MLTSMETTTPAASGTTRSKLVIANVPATPASSTTNSRIECLGRNLHGFMLVAA